MELRLLTPEQNVDQELRLLNHFLEQGLPYAHIRKPQFSLEEYENYIQNISSEYHDRLIMHGALPLIEKYDLGGVHLREQSRRDMEENDLKELMQYIHTKGMLIGSSVHAIETLTELAIGFDYIFVSPIFSSISKEGYHPSFDWDIRPHKDKYPFELVGLGGIAAATIPAAAAKGFESVGALGTVWKDLSNAEENFKALMEVCRSLE